MTTKISINKNSLQLKASFYS